MRKAAADDILIRPIGDTDAALFFDKKPNNIDSAVALLTLPEAAELLRISGSGMRRLQQGRHIPFFKVGGSIRFAKSDVLLYLARRRVDLIGK